jgi:hypothetical protein
MYQFSRALYRDLQPDLIDDSDRRALLTACEETFERLSRDRHHFAKPARALFREVRIWFPLDRQTRVHKVIAWHVDRATVYLDRMIAQGFVPEGTIIYCHALTRAGKACQREPLPGLNYCPSHQHLEEDRALSAA